MPFSKEFSCPINLHIPLHTYMIISKNLILCIFRPHLFENLKEKMVYLGTSITSGNRSSVDADHNDRNGGSNGHSNS